MDKLHAKYFKLVAAGGDLNAAAEMPLAEETIGITSTPTIVNHTTSDNPNPKDRVEIGTKFLVKGVLAEATQAQMVQFGGGSENAGVRTKSQGIRTLPKYDIRVAVYRASDGLLVLKDFTNMEFVGDLEESYNNGDRFYLAFQAESTSNSVYSSDNSAV